MPTPVFALQPATLPADVTLGAFTPLGVAVALWLAFVVYGLVALSKHPKGLGVLFFVEMWERFSYYGMRALLLLYMRLPVESGGLGLSLQFAGSIYAFYTFFVYALSVPGGWVAVNAARSNGVSAAKSSSTSSNWYGWSKR